MNDSLSPPDSWIESAANGMIPDTSGACLVCDEDLDAGNCTCRYCPYCEDNVERAIEYGEATELGDTNEWACLECAEKRCIGNGYE